MPSHFRRPRLVSPGRLIGGRFFSAVFILWAMFGLGRSADAQTALTWSGASGGGGGTNWSSTGFGGATNWAGNTTPANSGTYALLFNNNTRTTNANTYSNLTLTSLAFGPSAGAFTISGSAVTLRGVISNSCSA